MEGKEEEEEEEEKSNFQKHRVKLVLKKSIFSVSVSGSVEKKNGCFGRNEKKPFGCTLLSSQQTYYAIVYLSIVHSSKRKNFQKLSSKFHYLFSRIQSTVYSILLSFTLYQTSLAFLEKTLCPYNLKELCCCKTFFNSFSSPPSTSSYMKRNYMRLKLESLQFPEQIFCRIRRNWTTHLVC